LCSLIYLICSYHGVYVVYILKLDSDHALGVSKVMRDFSFPLMKSFNIKLQSYYSVWHQLVWAHAPTILYVRIRWYTQRVYIRHTSVYVVYTQMPNYFWPCSNFISACDLIPFTFLIRLPYARHTLDKLDNRLIC